MRAPVLLFLLLLVLIQILVFLFLFLFLDTPAGRLLNRAWREVPASLLLALPHRERVPRALLCGKVGGPVLARASITELERVIVHFVDAEDRLGVGSGVGGEDVDGAGFLRGVELEFA